MTTKLATACALVLIAVVLCTPVEAQDDSDLAQDLTNPVADLLTIPVQLNYDQNIGPVDKGWKLQTNIQPVYPFSLNDDWNLITRTIVPVISQDKIFPGAGSQFGLGDINLSMFFSPKRPTNGIIWGVGPALYFPTATDELLGAEKWGAGPTAVALTMRGRWTMGALANHLWSVAGKDRRDDINSTLVQPFASYTFPSAWTVSFQSETTYNWETEKWSVPLNVAVAKLVMMGRLPVSLSGGVGRWLSSPDGAADGWRFRVQANFVLPKP
jgi:hypothetical protein